MTWQIPTWWVFLLLALAAFRTWRIVAEDTIFDKPRAAIIKRFPKLEEWLACPWCAGFWITLLWWLAWIAWTKWTVIIAVPLALNAVMALIAANIDPD